MIEPRISSSSARCLVQSCIWGWAWLARPEVILALGSEVLLKEHKHGWKGLCLSTSPGSLPPHMTPPPSPQASTSPSFLANLFLSCPFFIFISPTNGNNFSTSTPLTWPLLLCPLTTPPCHPACCRTGDNGCLQVQVPCLWQQGTTLILIWAAIFPPTRRATWSRLLQAFVLLLV